MFWKGEIGARLVAIVLSLVLAVPIFIMVFGRKKWNPRGKTCLVTGGSQGLGLALATLLAKKGANVTIVARDENKLKAALNTLEASRQTSEQVFRYLSFGLHTAAGATAAIEAACESNGDVPPDAFFLCAGSSTPRFWVEATEEDIIKGMEQSYWVQAWPAHAISKKLVKTKRTGKIVFCASTLSLMSIVGYTPYTPGKTALKGLAETLRSEMLLYGIDVHILFSPTINSPGLEIEQRTKPDITKKIEEGDTPLSCDDAAQTLYNGIEGGSYKIPGNLITRIFSASSRGSTPTANAFIDPILDLAAWIAIPVWRYFTDSSIVCMKEQHQKYLESRGFFDTP